MDRQINYFKQSQQWISQGFETLVSELSSNDDKPLIHDVIIVGSGYGASIAAAQLASCKSPSGQDLNICILERGKEYIGGMFPSKLDEIPKHLRIRGGNGKMIGLNEGLFDIHLGSDVCSVSANGLGGGSLINAGVMEIPTTKVFNHFWPTALQRGESLWEYYDIAKTLLGAKDMNGNNTIERNLKRNNETLPKYDALRNLANDYAQHNNKHTDELFRPASLTIAMEDKQNNVGVNLKACKKCGDCATGCNHGAKESLDTNLLFKAQSQGVKIYTGASVLKLSRTENHQYWQVETVYTDERLQERHNKPIILTAKKVILAAGSLGSTEILQRSVSKDLPFSFCLGERFSTNGDNISVGYQHDSVVNAIADEQQSPEMRNVGPSITGIIDLRNTETALLFEEIAIPGAFKKIVEELYTTTNTLHNLSTADNSKHKYGTVDNDPFAVNPQAMAHSSFIVSMGNDDSLGTLKLTDSHSPEGSIAIIAPDLRKHPLFVKQYDTFNRMISNSSLRGRALPNPLWKFLPQELNFITDNNNIFGPLLTVHPLGGCCMGDHRHAGVVNNLGQVFDPTAEAMDAVYENLVVLDGSIIPTALETNPALSIAALALRAIRKLISASHWNFITPTEQYQPIATDRPTLGDVPDKPTAKKSTYVEIIERIQGEIHLQPYNSIPTTMVAEVTLSFVPKPIENIIGKNQYLQVNEDDEGADPRSKLRLFSVEDWQYLQRSALADKQYEQECNNRAKVIAPLKGKLTVMSRANSGKIKRKLHSLWAWALNRGLRDIWQTIFDRDQSTQVNTSKLLNLVWNYSNRAGEIRLLEYDLSIGSLLKSASKDFSELFNAQKQNSLIAVKRFNYSRRSNPWKQLMEAQLLEFPNLQQSSSKISKLYLDVQFLSRSNLPLMRIVKQENYITSLIDMVSLASYFIRALVSIHLHSFRKPDTFFFDRPAQRLPTVIKHLPTPDIHKVVVGHIPQTLPHIPHLKAGDKTYIQLTRYANDSQLPPVIMIHGYSASGSTFTHHAVNPNFANYFWRLGRDVWVVDLRTSSGLETAHYPWTFEDIACADIPAAFSYIHRVTQRKIDVVAHCMGSVMFSMAILGSQKKLEDLFEPSKSTRQDVWREERKLLPQLVNRVALSQVNPVVIFSASNIFRGYILNYLKNYLPTAGYSFNPQNRTTIQNLLDRLFYSIPYPEEEYDIENPPWTPWRQTPFTSIRHRMDALYGRDFDLKNISPKVLEYIDDLFGPLNFNTVSQGIYFSRHSAITNSIGHNVFVSPSNIRQTWTFPTIMLHGENNGLADVASVQHMVDVFATAGVHVESKIFPDHGHQDCLIGRHAEQFFEVAETFLMQRKTFHLAPLQQLCKISLPYYGPVVGKPIINDENYQIPIMCGASDGMNAPHFIAFIAVTEDEDQLNNPDNKPFCLQSIRDNLQIQPIQHPLIYNWIKTSITTNQSNGRFLLLLIYDQASYIKSVPHDSLAITDHPLNLDDNVKNRFCTAILQTLDTQPINDLRQSIIYYDLGIQANDQLCFALGSCQYPAGIIDQIPAYTSYACLSKRLDSEDIYGAIKPEILLLLGDQIYSDATAGLFDPTDIFDKYINRYYEWYSKPSVRSVLRRLPTHMMPDDHEFIDNWEPTNNSTNTSSQLSKTLANGLYTYRLFQEGLHQQRQGTKDTQRQAIWYNFKQCGFHFFMADARTERTLRNANTLEQAKIMSGEQQYALYKWLEEHKNSNRPLLIATGSMLLPRRHDTTHISPLRSDCWDGYPSSLHHILLHIASHQINNVIFLSGDEHLSCVAKITIHGPNGYTHIHSIHSSALYAPMPFANTNKKELLADDHFILCNEDNNKTAYQCYVTAEFPATGDGFTLIKISKEDERWQIDCEFLRQVDSETSTAITRHYYLDEGAKCK